MIKKDSELVKSKERVEKHGEVFTPKHTIESMLSLVKEESSRIDSRFLEPACGNGNFLKIILEKKLKTVKTKYNKSDYEKKHYALFSLMCVYGIELLEDNVKECRDSLLLIYSNFLLLNKKSTWYQAGRKVLEANIIHGDALTIKTTTNKPIEFPEWSYLGAGKFQRRDFKYENLAERASFKNTLFELLEDNQLFIPTKTYPPMSIEELSK